MSEKYTELYRLPSILLIEGCPVIIEAGTLLKNNENGHVLAQLKINNGSNNKLHECRVCINPIDVNGIATDSIEYLFSDLEAYNGMSFGTQQPIYLPDDNTRSYDVCILELVFENGTIWKHENCKWNTIGKQTDISEFFNDEKIKEQFQREEGYSAEYVPDTFLDFWRCTCGMINSNANESCSKCNRKLQIIEEHLDSNYLYDRLNEHIEGINVETREIRSSVCPECGRGVSSDAKVCPHCGYELINNKITIEKQNDDSHSKNKKRLKIILIAVPIIVLILAFLVSFKVIQKRQTEELISTIENSFNNRIFVNTEMEEVEKNKIQISELDSYSTSHKILLVNGKIKKRYQKLLSLLNEQADILSQVEDIKINSEYETIMKKQSCNMSEVSGLFMSLVNDYGMCSDNEKLKERFAVNQKLFDASVKVWDEVSSIDSNTRKQIITGGSFELKNNTEYKVTFAIMVLDDSGENIVGGDAQEVLPGESVTISKPVLWSDNTGDVLILPVIEDPRESVD